MSDPNSSWIPVKTVAIEERKLGIFYEGRITDADTDFKDFNIAIQTESTYDGFFEIKKIELDQYSIRLASELSLIDVDDRFW